MMTKERAREIWKGYDMDDKTLQEWVDLVNERQITMYYDDPNIPIGCTIEYNKNLVIQANGNEKPQCSNQR